MSVEQKNGAYVREYIGYDHMEWKTIPLSTN
jgi:hypothetical protein